MALVYATTHAGLLSLDLLALLADKNCVAGIIAELKRLGGHLRICQAWVTWTMARALQLVRFSPIPTGRAGEFLDTFGAPMAPPSPAA